jgi:hypothetical protein
VKPLLKSARVAGAEESPCGIPKVLLTSASGRGGGDFPSNHLARNGNEFAAAPHWLQTGNGVSMGNEDGPDKRALEDCNETLDELKQQNAELQDENQELREASTTFGDLAERLSKELRKENESVKTGTTIAAEPEGEP